MHTHIHTLPRDPCSLWKCVWAVGLRDFSTLSQPTTGTTGLWSEHSDIRSRRLNTTHIFCVFLNPFKHLLLSPHSCGKFTGVSRRVTEKMPKNIILLSLFIYCLFLKGNSTDFTCELQFIGLEEYYSDYESCGMSSEALEGAFLNLKAWPILETKKSQDILAPAAAILTFFFKYICLLWVP